MPDAYNVYFSSFVVDLIENAPITYSYSPEIVGACEFETTLRARVLQ
jgi:hypothetical protein